MRTAPGKSDFIVLDHAGNLLEFGRPIDYKAPDFDELVSRQADKAKNRDNFRLCFNCDSLMKIGMMVCPLCDFEQPKPPPPAEI